MRFAPEESQEEPGLVFERVVGYRYHQQHVCVHTRMRARTLARTQMKETNDLDYILCYLVDYKSVKPSLYIDLQYI